MVTQQIKLKEKTKNKLDELKIHHRETYDDVVVRLLQKKGGVNDRRKRGKANAA